MPPEQPQPQLEPQQALKQAEEPPAADAKPLPKMEDMIAHAKARQALTEDLQKTYTYKQTALADEFDSHGNKKGTHTDEYQEWMVKNVTVQQHLSHDGKPLSPDEARKEQDRVDKEVASIKNGSYKGRNGNIRVSVSALLQVATFSNERRVDVNGRPTIEFDYHGNSEAKASDLFQEVMKKVTGELWLDEEDAAVVRLDGKLDENFHIAGGLLVNVKAGSSFELTNAHINGEIWFLQHLEAHGDGRILLFKGFDGNANFTFSDYRKMKTSVTLLPGSQVIGEDGKPIPNLQVEPGAATPEVPK